MLFNHVPSLLQQLLLYGPLLLLSYIVVQIIRLRFFHPLSSFPGPFVASITPLWMAVQLALGRSHVQTLNLHRKYGPVFRNGPNSLSFSSPLALDPIYGHRPKTGTEFYKSKFYWVFTPTTSDEDYNIFTARYTEQHARMRKCVAPVYALNNMLEKYEGAVDGCVKDWIDRIAELGANVDFEEWSHYLPLDVISEVAYGKRIGFIEKGMDEGYFFLSSTTPLSALNKIMKSRWLGPWLNPSPKDKTGYGALLGVIQSSDNNEIQVAEKIVNDRMANGNTIGKPHLVQSFTELDDSGPLSKERVLGETMITIIAGSDSTAIALLSCVYYVSQYPEVQKKLSEEIKEFERKGLISNPIKYTEAVKMPYLQAVVKEAMRLYPSFGGTWPRIVAKGGYEILPNVWVPGGTDVGVCAYVSNRDTATFGKDANQFCPERWLPLDGERSKELEKLQCTFGYTYSSRVCIGKNLAMMELYKSVTAVQLFDLTLIVEKLLISTRSSGGLM
ncbi:cytochrome P450 [Geopyxis carbonaria]|nr:cytochrome P450 [Geopyxis carbonaria]